MKNILFTILIALGVSTFSGCNKIDRDNTDTTVENDNGSSRADRRDDNTDKEQKDDDKTAHLPKIINKNKDYQILAWNDLGMHCMDGSDYSVFSILPPYNNLLTQLVKKGVEPQESKLVTSDVIITYEAVLSLNGKSNTSSADKTNFWKYTKMLFNVDITPDIGLKGYPVQSEIPASLHYKNAFKWWSAEGIPVMPKNDDLTTNEYPMVRVVAKNTKVEVLAETITVLPVSDEMDCKKCHSSSSGYSQAKPFNGYVNDANSNKDYKYNILRLHDEKHDISSYLESLKGAGYRYKSSLEQTAREGTPILCATCHKSNALGTKGVANISSLTSAIHKRHSNVFDPKNGKRLNDSTNRDACYSCHPGAKTQCLRGAMGSAKDENGVSKMQCQSCHGSMSAVGAPKREGWLQQPNCQACHQNGKRYSSAVTDIKSGTLRAAVDRRFATNPNTPSKGVSLYRYSTGHGGLQCAACHGSTHAIYNSARAEDNIESINAQGHAGTISKCNSCHKYMPETINGGPHGMHSIGVTWVHDHQSAVVNNGSESCKSCHGKDLKGTPLSKVFSPKRLNGKSYAKDGKVGCYDCHNGPTGIAY